MSSEFVVYPRLKKVAAEKLANQLSSKPIEELISEYPGVSQTKVDYSPTGNRIRPEELTELQSNVRACATLFGYPKVENTSDTTYSNFDAQCAELLHKNMKIFPAEAAHIEVWAFMTCVLLPDVVRWRFYDRATAVERFIGANRGLRRNTLGRLWWRAYLLHNPNAPEPYKFIHQLGEDELVQITERTSIAKNPVLISAAAEAFLSTIEAYPEMPRRELMREATKRIRRLVSLLSFEALDENEVKQIMYQTFEQTRQAFVLTLEAARR